MSTRNLLTLASRFCQGFRISCIERLVTGERVRFGAQGGDGGDCVPAEHSRLLQWLHQHGQLVHGRCVPCFGTIKSLLNHQITMIECERRQTEIRSECFVNYAFAALPTVPSAPAVPAASPCTLRRCFPAGKHHGGIYLGVDQWNVPAV